MNRDADKHDADHVHRLTQHALGMLPAAEAAAVERHAATCQECRGELETLRRAVGAFVAWPADVLRPPAPLWGRITERIGNGSGAGEGLPDELESEWTPKWTSAAPGIDYVLLAEDAETHRVGMLVRLAPGAAYPPHRHADVEELTLLNGELYIEDRLLLPGDYNRAAPGTADQRVFSETGCSCILITSSRDVLG